MRADDLLAIVGIALVCGAAVGVAGLVALRLSRRAPMVVQVSIVVLTGTLSVVAGMVAVARAMFLSQHDLVVGLWVAGIAGAVALGVAAVLAITFVRQARRVRRMAAVVGDEPLQAMDASGSELAAVAGELARTSRRLEEARAEVAALDESRREFVAWISHDLRTPLAGLRAMAEALEDGLADDPQRFHRQMRVQVDHLSDLVDDLFELSKIESGRLILAMESVSLHDLVSDAVAELHALAAVRDVTIRESPSSDVFVTGDARELGRAVGNVLLNAIQHSPPGSSIRIETSSGEHLAVLAVVDQGGGIAEADLDEVFRAGWRGAPSRPPLVGRSSGAGLGLAIARGILVAHGGSLDVENVPGGSRFAMTLAVAG